MSDLHFTEEETHLVEAMARDRHGVASRLGFYASVLVPVFIFGTYGIVHRDFLATVLSLLGLGIFVCWNLSQESKYVLLYKSIFQKVAQHQRGVPSVAQQSVQPDRREDAAPV
jgi:hypothetical protein